MHKMKINELRKFITKTVHETQQSSAKPSQPFRPPVGQKPAFVAPVSSDEFGADTREAKAFVHNHAGTTIADGVLPKSGARYYNGTIKGQFNVDNKDRKGWIGIELVEGRDATVDILSGKDVQKRFSLSNKELIEIMRRAGNGPTSIDEFVKMVMRKGKSLYVKQP